MPVHWRLLTGVLLEADDEDAVEDVADVDVFVAEVEAFGSNKLWLLRCAGKLPVLLLVVAELEFEIRELLLFVVVVLVLALVLLALSILAIVACDGLISSLVEVLALAPVALVLALLAAAESPAVLLLIVVAELRFVSLPSKASLSDIDSSPRSEKLVFEVGLKEEFSGS